MAAHELLGQDGALDIAVVMAADAQDGVLAVGVDLAVTSAGTPVVVSSRSLA
jgi:hypothetical protein